MKRLLHRHLALPAFETLVKKRKTFRYLSDLNKSQWLAPAELNQLQFSALQRLMTHAFDRCPYYRSSWEALNLGPAKLKQPDDFGRWPVIDRGVISEHRQQMRANGAAQLLSKSTGGSSGEPLHFDLNADSNDRRSAASFRGYEWAGAHLGKKLLYLWGVALGEQRLRSRIKDSLYHLLYRRRFLNCFDLSEQRVSQFLTAHNSYKPDVLVAYTNALYEFANFLEAACAKPFSPQAIVVGAEKLYPFQRQLIERVFQAPVFETYGSREFMLIGAECDRHAGLHLTHEHLLVEVLNDDGSPTPDGEEGNVVITDLFNYGMPFIRYMNGDRAIAGLKSCSCGRGLPLLQCVTGRTLDVITTPDQRRLPGEFFPHLMKDFASVKRFQVVQDAADRVQMRVVASNGWDEPTRQRIEHLVEDALGPSCRFDLLRVDDIPLTRSGKLKVVVNQTQSSPLAAETSVGAAV
jgi:phenylacetate-CoA ligase